jgi:hypothetical protein
MKKLNFILMITMTVFIFSCNKKESIQPVEEKSVAVAQSSSFNEKNSNAISWNQLPEKLKNAEIYNADHSSGTVGKVDASYLTSVGPWGGRGGNPYAIYPLASTDKIYAIAIRSGSFVDGITVWYIRTNGSIYASVAGGTGGIFYLQLFGANEYITAIAGRSGTYLDRLTIYTNSKNFSYGGNGGNAFYAGAGTSQILGLYGSAGKYIDKIGAFVYTF